MRCRPVGSTSSVDVHGLCGWIPEDFCFTPNLPPAPPPARDFSPIPAPALDATIPLAPLQEGPPCPASTNTGRRFPPPPPDENVPIATIAPAVASTAGGEEEDIVVAQAVTVADAAAAATEDNAATSQVAGSTPHVASNPPPASRAAAPSSESPLAEAPAGPPPPPSNGDGQAIGSEERPASGGDEGHCGVGEVCEGDDEISASQGASGRRCHPQVRRVLRIRV